MGYQAVYLIERGYHDDPFCFINLDEAGLIETEPWDGSRIRRYFPEEIHLWRKPAEKKHYKERLFYADAPIEFLITDSRVMIRLDRYEDSYYKDDTMAAVLCRERRKQKSLSRNPMILAGMIRFEWISRISYEQKVSFSTREALRIYYKDKGWDSWYLEVVFQKEDDAEYIANEILHRTCSYRLAMTDDKDREEMLFFARYKKKYEIEPAADPRTEMASIDFPTQYPAPAGVADRPYATSKGFQ